MKAPQLDKTELIDQALVWIERLKTDDGISEGFFDWLTESPRHVEVFMQAMTLQQRIAAIDTELWSSLREKSIRNDAAPTNIIPLSERPLPAPKSARQRRWLPAAMAAGLAIAAIGSWLAYPILRGWQTFTTAAGEQRTIQLQDGSTVSLNTGSSVKIHLSARARDIRLTKGEALFKVQRDNLRPFRVHTRDTVIRAIGTQFNVYRRTTGTTVSVLEGRVQVETERRVTKTPVFPPQPLASSSNGAAADLLSAGEQAHIADNGHIARRGKLNANQVMAWQQRRLIFDEETLTNIVYEFNRYNRHHFRIDDTDAGARRFSGIFDADDPESLAQLLARDGGLRLERGNSETVIRKQ